MPEKDLPCPGSKIRSKGMGRGLGIGGGKGPIGLPIGEKMKALRGKREDKDEDKGKKKRKDKDMSDEKKAAADQEGVERLMAFAMGIDRRCERDQQYTYGTLAKAAGVREDMLAPALVDVLVQASEDKEKK
jgi:hypothetical protein